jgi:hypothetical protein
MPRIKPAAWRPGTRWQPGAARLVPAYFVYIPGGTVTTWHSRAVMRVFHEQLPSDVPYALRAQAVMDALRSYVESGGKETAPPREEIVRLALVKNPAYAGPAVADPGVEPEPPPAPPVPAAPAQPGDSLPPSQKST